MIRVRIDSGQEVIAGLTQRLGEEGIQEGAIVSVIGAVDQCQISTMPKEDARHDILTEYAEPVEMFGSGMVIGGTPHIHCILGRQGDEARAGHLHWAKVRTWFVDVAVIPASDRNNP